MDASLANRKAIDKESFRYRVKKDFIVNKSLYLLVLPVVLYYIIFNYVPMYGAIIAFKDFIAREGILGSPWVGLKHFRAFFESPFFYRLFRNTLTISLTSLIFGFPMPIILALLINEIRSKYFSRIVQTVSYLPHFISLVVVCSMIKEFTADQGVINDLIVFLGGERTIILNNEDLFVWVYVISEIWQEIGWGSIIYLAAISGIDQQLYDAAVIDGAGKWKQLLHVTLPGIKSTIVVMLILRMGNIMNIGFEKIILLYNPLTYERADVIASFVYRKGIYEMNYSYGAAVGLFNSVINCILLLSFNTLSKRMTGQGIY